MGPNSKVTFLKVLTTKSPTYVIKKKKKVTNLQSQEVQKIYKDTASPTLTTQPRPKAKEHIFSPFLPEPTIDTNGFGGESLCSVHGDGLCPCVQCSCVQGWGLCRLDHHW